MLHVHPVLGYGSARQMAGARDYLERLSELAPQYGFGFVDHRPDKVKPQPALQAAAYVSSYFVIGKGHKTALAESGRASATATKCSLSTSRLNLRWRLAGRRREPAAASVYLRCVGAQLAHESGPYDRLLPKSIPRLRTAAGRRTRQSAAAPNCFLLTRGCSSVIIRSTS